MAEKKEIASLDFNITSAEKKLKDLNKQFDDLSKKANTVSDSVSKKLNNGNTGTIDTKKAEDKLKQLETMTKKYGKRIAKSWLDNENAKERIALKSDKAIEKSAYDSMLKQESYNQRIAKSTEDLYSKIKQYAKTYIIYQGFNELKKGIQETVDEMVEIEQRMVAIDRVMNIANMNTKAFRDSLIQLAQDYGNSFDNVADISLRLAQAGVKGADNLKLVEKTLLALNTADLNATQATDDMIAVMSQWGYLTGDAAQQANKYGEIIDKINKVADNFPITSEDIMNALKKTSSAWKLAGASIDETIASIVAAEKASQRGGKVIGTALSNIVQQLKAEKKLDLAEQLGLNFYEDDAKTKFKPIMEIFEEMSNRMAALKEQGKESSVEMQSLLEMFTVFRRNIGASLLGEMEGGEESTYAQALNTSLHSLGYSLQENEKYMKTAKAAQEQFNAEMLKFKTQIWDDGLEKVFRDLLAGGKDFLKWLQDVVKTIGPIPAAIGLITAAITTLKGTLKIGDINKLRTAIKAANDAIKKGAIDTEKYNQALVKLDGEEKTYTFNIKNGKVSLIGYTKEMVKTTAQTALMTAGTIALNAALSAGLTVITTALAAGLDLLFHAQEKNIEAAKEAREEAEANAQKYQDEISSIEDLRKQYEELAKKENKTTEDQQKIYEIQEQINELLKGTGQQVELIQKEVNEHGKEVEKVNDKYDEQLQLIKAIEREKKAQKVEELRIAAKNAEGSQEGVKLEQGWWKTQPIANAAGKLLPELYENTRGGQGSIFTFETGFNQKSYKEQYEILTKVRNAIYEAEDGTTKYKDALEKINELLPTLRKQQENVNSAIQAYNDAVAELYEKSQILDSYNMALNGILKTYGSNENIKKIVNDIRNLNNSFEEGKITSKEYFENLNKSAVDSASKIKEIKEKIVEIESSKIDFKDPEFVEKAEKNVKAINELTNELKGYEAVFTETTRTIAQSMQEAMVAYDEGTMTYYDYQEALAQTSQSLLELYAAQNELHFDEQNKQWVDAAGNVNEYATSLQNATDVVEEFSQMLRGLGESYDYIAEHANAAGEAAFIANDVGTEAYNTLATNFANSLADMRRTNFENWSNIVKDIEGAAEQVGNEELNVDEYVKNALLTSSDNLNTTLTNANKEAQNATATLGQKTGELFTDLANVIENFDYTIDFGVTGGINPGGNLLDLAMGKTFKPTSDLQLTINGSGGSSVRKFAEDLKDFGTNLGSWIDQNSYNSLLKNIKPYTPYKSGSTNATTPYSPSSPVDTGGSGSGGSSRNTERETTKAEEDEYKKRLDAFKAYISEKERLENRWVVKQKELGQLTTKDFLYITEQRIKRYEEYLEAVEQATWMHEEDKLALEKEYSEKIEDLQVSYLGYLKDQLNEEIDAIKKANTEKINSIKEEASTRIDALKKVEKENDRIRAKEEYEENRKKHLTDISYWEQRTGREAQNSLKEAKEKLAELDKDWKEKQEDWDLDDQIKAIEDARDAEIKSIEEMQEKEIEALQKAYDARVKLYAETGQIIYDQATIQSQKLYEAYKDNFIDPIKSDLTDLNKTVAPVTNTVNVVSSSNPLDAKSVDELATEVIRGVYGNGQARRDALGGRYEEVQAEVNRRYKIGKFHDGGIVGGTREALALLKPHEVILKPEWAEGINKLAAMAKNSTNTNAMTTNSTVIEVKGDLVKVEAKIDSQASADYLTRKIEKTLKDKFNIKK